MEEHRKVVLQGDITTTIISTTTYLNKAQGDGDKAVANCQDDGSSHGCVEVGCTIDALYWVLA